MGFMNELIQKEIRNELESFKQELIKELYGEPEPQEPEPQEPKPEEPKPEASMELKSLESELTELRKAIVNLKSEPQDDKPSVEEAFKNLGKVDY